MGRKSKYDSVFKTKVVPEALKERETLSELAKKYGVVPKQITEWKKEFLEKSGMVFGDRESESKELKSLKAENEKLLKKVGQLTIEVDFCRSLRGIRSEEEIRDLDRQAQQA